MTRKEEIVKIMDFLHNEYPEIINDPEFIQKCLDLINCSLDLLKVSDVNIDKNKMKAVAAQLRGIISTVLVNC